MKCLSKEELILALGSDGTLDPGEPHVHEHVAHCAACRALLEEYRSVLALTARIFDEEVFEETHYWVDDNLIAGYIDNNLDEDVREQVERHIAGCPRCANQLSELAEYMKAVGPREQGLTFALKIMRNGLSMLRHPASGFHSGEAAPVLLGAEDGDTRPVLAWSQDIDDLRLDFSAVHVDDEHVSLAVNIYKLVSDRMPTRLSLWENGELVQSECLSDCGGLVLQNLRAASYRAEIEVNEHTRIPLVIDLARDEES